MDENGEKVITADSLPDSGKAFSKEDIARIKSNEKLGPYFFVKSAIDWLLALVAFLLLLVPFILIGIISFCADPGRVFFTQVRCGRNGKPIRIIKFRTMKKGSIGENVSAEKLKADDYKKTCNAWQRFLRKTSIDELPQIMNILAFQMAFIGPRPLIYQESDVIQERIYNGSIHCKPGLGGLAQVNGRRKLSQTTKGGFDGEYYAKMSFLYDLKLWFKTIFAVLGRFDAA